MGIQYTEFKKFSGVYMDSDYSFLKFLMLLIQLSNAQLIYTHTHVFLTMNFSTFKFKTFTLFFSFLG